MAIRCFLKRSCCVLFLLHSCLSGFTQDIFTRGIVYQDPAMKRVTVRERIVYRTIRDTVLTMDVYYPPGYDRTKPLPVVIFNNGAGGLEVPRWGVYRDWAKLIAANGMIAINHQSRRGSTLTDGETLIDYLVAHGSELSIDTGRMALWTCSANTPIGLRIAFKTRPERIRTVVQYYGTPDSLGELRQDLPILIVRAGKDAQFINNGIDHFLQQALDQDIRVSFINYLEGIHAFDVFTNSDESRLIIRQTVEFLKRNLNGPAVAKQLVLTNKHFLWMLRHGQFDAALASFRKVRDEARADPNFQPFFNAVIREDVLNANAYLFLQDRQLPQALELFHLLVESYPSSANAYESLSEADEANHDTAAALTNARHCLELLKLDTLMSPQFRQVVRGSAEARIGRLQSGQGDTGKLQPARRAHHELVYDANNGCILMTAGSTPIGNTGEFSFFNDLWQYDGTRWTATGRAGDERSGMRLVFDTRRKKIFSFGGYARGESLGDLRMLENGNWITLSSDTTMKAAEPGLVYDSKRDRLVVFGGSAGKGHDQPAMWEWVNGAWKKFEGTVPPARQGFAMVYDRGRGKTILYGGVNAGGLAMNDGVWEFDGIRWANLAQQQDGPGPRISPGATFDTKRGLMLLFGGMANKEMLGDTWSWNGQSWKRLAVEGLRKRVMGYMAYDERRDRTVLFGGRPGWPEDANDTWEWDGTAWKEVQP